MSVYQNPNNNVPISAPDYSQKDPKSTVMSAAPEQAQKPTESNLMSMFRVQPFCSYV